MKIDNELASEYKQKNKKWLCGNVYILDYGDGKTFKVGFTKNEPEYRVKQISKSNVIMPMQLVMSGFTMTNAFFLENLIQMKLDDKHINGEWYKLNFEDLVEIYQILQLFGGASITDRWFELVPKDYQKMINYYVISDNFPVFEKKNQLTVSEVFGE